MSNTFTTLAVSTLPSANINSTTSGGVTTITPFFDNAVVSASDVVSLLPSSDVRLDTVDSPDNGEAGDILVDPGAAITWTSSHTLTFDAAGGLNLAGTISGTSGVLVLKAQSGTITGIGDDIHVAHLTGSSTGATALLDTSNAIAELDNFSTGSNFTLTDNIATLAIGGSVSAHDITITNFGGTIAHALSTDVQHLVVTGGAGSFTLTYAGQTTAPLAFNATTATILNALEALPALSGSGVGVSISGTAGSGVYDISFGGTVGDGVASLLAATGSGGAAAAVTATGGSTVSGHDVTLTADDIVLDSHTTITATDAITLAPKTFFVAVVLGSGIPQLGLAIDDAELGTLSAPTLTIGSATAGQVNIGTATVSSATLDLVSAVGVSSFAGDTLTVGGGAGTLNVTAAATVDLFSGTIDIGAVGGSTTGGDFKLNETTSGALSVNAITTAQGEIVVKKFGGDLNLDGALHSGSNILLENGNALNIDNTIDAGAAAIALIGSTQGITQNSGVLAGGSLMAVIGSLFGDIALTGAANAISGNVDLNAGPIGGDISFTDLLGYTIGGFSATPYSSIGDTETADPGIRTAAGQSVTLTMGADVHEAGGAGDIVSTGTLNLLRLPGDNPTVRLDNTNNVIDDLHTVDLGNGGLTLFDSVSLTVDGAVSAGSLTLTTTGSFTLAASGSIAMISSMTLQVATDATLDGVISGNGDLALLASGIVTLTATDSYHGGTTVASGTLLVDGSIASSVETDVQHGASLGGHGTVGALHVFSGGTLSPGDSPGVLTSGAVTLDSGAHFHAEIGGTAAGSFDQLQVHGAVNLGGATLDLSLVNGFTPSLGESFTLISNDGSDPVNGTFAGLAEAAQINLGGTSFTLSYHGGDGNDVTLTAPGATPGDFNADRIGDVLWQNNAGSASEWLMQGGAIVSNLGVGSDSGLHFLDTGDFNADGRSDVLWRDDSGNVTLWTMNSAQILGKQTLGNVSSDWQNQGVADFNRDGHDDVLWRDGGAVSLWTTNGAQVTANQSVSNTLTPDWHIQGLGDFNGDGNSDVLLRNSTSGQLVLWTMNGAQITANQSIENLGLDWHVLGVGDFTGDGKADILLRNDDSQVVLLTMNDNQIVANQNVGNIDASWHVQGVSDYTGDGKADVLWRNDSGQVALWEMNGNQITSDHQVNYANGAANTTDNSWAVLHHQFDLV